MLAVLLEGRLADAGFGTRLADELSEDPPETKVPNQRGDLAQMSLAVVVKGAEGIVLAADSRVTIGAQRRGDVAPIMVNFDNATKLLAFSEPNSFVGAVTYGDALIGPRTAHSFIPEFEVALKKRDSGRLKVNEFAKKLSDFYLDQWSKAAPQNYQGPGMTFIVCGYDDGEPYGKVFALAIPNEPDPSPRNPEDFGMSWGGQLNISSRIVHGYDPALPAILQEELNLDSQQMGAVLQVLKENLEFHIPYQVLPLQDCIDLATFLIRSTITAQGLAVGVRGVGGQIEVAVITRTKPLSFVQQKKIRGEPSER